MKDSKKLQELYEAYLRDSLESMDREEMIDTFVTTVLKFMDFDQPVVKEQVIKILMRYEARKKRGIEEAQEDLGEDPPAPESHSGEELDFTSMYKPSDFDDLLRHLTLLSMSHSDTIELEDLLNATSTGKSIRKYMFDVEVPWVGLIDNVLCFAWSKDKEKTMVVLFNGGLTQMEFTHKEDMYVLDFTDEGEVESDDILRVIAETHALAY